MKKTRCALCYAVLAVCFALLLAVSVGTGSAALSPHEILRILLLREGAGTAAYNVLLKIRLPRVLAAAVMGGTLSVSGFLLQTFFRNPIAGPYVLGVSSGASLGVLTMTAALFVFFKELRLTPGAKAQRALLLVSKCTFGVYLVHALVLERLDIAYPVAAGALLLSIVGVSLLVFLVLLAISVAMSRIPGLKKVI